MLHRLILNGHEIPAKVRTFAETQWQRPSIRAFVEHERPAKK
jgi:glutathione S-transferase